MCAHACCSIHNVYIHTARVCNVLYSQKGECPPSKPPAVKSPGSHGNSPHEHAAGQPPPPVYIPS